MSRARANLLLLLAGAIWGMGFVAQSEAMGDIGPQLFVGLRFALAAIAVLPFALRESRRASRPVEGRNLAGFIACGLALFLGMTAQQIGLLTTSVTNSGFLTGLYVVLTPVLAVVWTRQRPHPVVWLSALASLAGIWLLSGGAMTSPASGDLLTLAGAGLFAVQVTLIGIFASAGGRPLALSFVQFAVCAVLGLAGAAVFEPVSIDAIRAAMPEIVYAGVFSSGLAFSLQVIGQRGTTAAQAAIMLSTEALFAAIFGAIFLGERIGIERSLGCLLIFAAILLTEIVPSVTRRMRASSPRKIDEQTKANTAELSHYNLKSSAQK